MSALSLALISGQLQAPIVMAAEPDPAPEAGGIAPPAGTPGERYATFAQMTAQLAEQLARVTERLPGGRPPGLIGENGFVTEHASMLAASIETLKSGVAVPEKRQAGHEKAVLSFLDQATRLTRLVNDLEKAETSGRRQDAEDLRRQIAEFQSLHLFQALAAEAPARLVVTTDEEPSGTVYWPQTIHRVGITVENRGDALARRVALRITPHGSVIANVADDGDSCSEDREISAGPTEPEWICQRATLDAGERWDLSVAFRHGAPQKVGAGPAEEVRVRVSVSAREPALDPQTADAKFAVANCSANYHQALVAMRDAEARLLLERMKEVRGGEQYLPRRWLARQIKWPDDEIVGLFGRAAPIVKARGSDPWLAAQAKDRDVSRVVYGLRAYIKQDPYPALCTGPTRVIESYRGFLAEFDRRRQQTSADVQRARILAEEAVARVEALQGVPAAVTAPAPDDTPQVNPAPPEPVSLGEMTARLAAALAIELDPGLEGAEAAQADIFAAVKAIADERLAGKTRSDEALAAAREALALIEATFYFNEARRRYELLGRALDDTLAGIANADAAQCHCQSSDYAIAPTTAPVPVPGIEAPPRMPRPRPKPGE